MPWPGVVAMCGGRRRFRGGRFRGGPAGRSILRGQARGAVGLGMVNVAHAHPDKEQLSALFDEAHAAGACKDDDGLMLVPYYKHIRRSRVLPEDIAGSPWLGPLLKARASVL